MRRYRIFRKEIAAHVITEGIDFDPEYYREPCRDLFKELYEYREQSSWHEIGTIEGLKDTRYALKQVMFDDNWADEYQTWYMDGFDSCYGHKATRLREEYSFRCWNSPKKSVNALSEGLYVQNRGPHPLGKLMYLVIADNGRIVPFDELFPPLERHGRTRCRQAWRVIWYDSWRERGATPQEIREIRDEYGITIPGDKVFGGDDFGISLSKSWKDQSKRKHQYRD